MLTGATDVTLVILNPDKSGFRISCVKLSFQHRIRVRHKLQLESTTFDERMDSKSSLE